MNYLLKTLGVGLIMLALSIFMTSCEQEGILTGENENIALQTTTELNTMPEVIVDRILFYETAEFVPHYYINIGMSPKAYKLDKQNPATVDFVQLIKNTEKSHTIKPLKVTIDESGIFVNSIVEADALEEKNWKESSRGKIWDTISFITDDEDLNLEDNTGDISLRNYSEVFSSYSKIKSAFRKMDSYRCNPSGNNAEGCIPFDYLGDGCYARAHRMKQLMELHYNRTCRKIFVFSDFLNGQLLDIPGCSNGWTFHVAPLVQLETTGKWYVIDPSLGDEPLKIGTWKEVLKKSNICKTKIKNGEIYGGIPMCTDNIFYKDVHYSSTNRTLAKYERITGC